MTSTSPRPGWCADCVEVVRCGRNGGLSLPPSVGKRGSFDRSHVRLSCPAVALSRSTVAKAQSNLMRWSGLPTRLSHRSPGAIARTPLLIPPRRPPRRSAGGTGTGNPKRLGTQARRRWAPTTVPRYLWLYPSRGSSVHAPHGSLRLWSSSG